MIPGSARRLLLVASNGGHLNHLLKLRPWWSQYDRSWVTFEGPDARSALAGEDVRWAYRPTTRNIPNLLRNLVLARRTLTDGDYDVVVSSGAAVAFPFFLVARTFAIPTVYLEVYDRIYEATLTGRLCHPITSLFLVQWEEQLRLYPKAALVGRLF